MVRQGKSDLSIVIVTWQSRVLVLECLESILETRGALDLEVQVVDNNSSDGTAHAIAERFPDVIVHQNVENVGFARASNQGIAASSGRNVMLLNPDTVVLPDALKQLVHMADQHHEIGLLGPTLLGADGKIQYVCARRLPRVLDWLSYYSFVGQALPGTKVFGGLNMSWWDHADSRPVEAICGACMLIPRRVIERIGMLDESHPMYLEDIDYCARVKRAGLITYFTSEARILHFGAKSSAQIEGATATMGLEALRLFFLRYYGRAHAVFFCLAVAFAQLVRLPTACGYAVIRTASLSHNGAWAVVRCEWSSLLWAMRGGRAFSGLTESH